MFFGLCILGLHEGLEASCLSDGFVVVLETHLPKLFSSDFFYNRTPCFGDVTANVSPIIL